MEELADEKFLHDWVIRRIKEQFSKQFNEISINTGEQKQQFNGFFPDVILGNYGQVVQILEVETASTINLKRIEYWKQLSNLGVQLFIVVPRAKQNYLRELFWESGLAAKVKIGTYDVSIKL